MKPAVRGRPERRSTGRLALVCLALLAGLAPAEPARAQGTARDTLPVVRNLEISGNEKLSDDELKRAIATRSSGCRSAFLSPFCWLGLDAFKRKARLDLRELRTDLARLRIYYFRRGYRQVQVDTALVREGKLVDVTFVIDEGQPVLVGSLEARGLEGIAPRLARNLPLNVGAPFSEVELGVSRDRLERGLRNLGYAEAAVLVEASIPGADTLTAHVVLEVIPGPRYNIGAIEVEGTSELDPRDVVRLLTFRSGDLYREDEIVRSQRTLYSLALFDYVDITAEPSGADSTIDVRVQVNEAEMRGVQFGVGVSTTECLQLEAGWAHRNLYGGTRRLDVTGVLSNLGTQAWARQFPCNQAGDTTELATNPFNKINWRLRAEFQQPWLLGTQNWLRLGVFTERQSLPPIYARVSYGGDARLTREIAPGTALSASFRAGRDSLEEGSADFLFCANFGVCTPSDIETLSETRWLNWVTLDFVRSTTDAVLSPTRGYRLSLEGEHASRLTGSEWTYYRAQAELSWYQRFGPGRIVALRVRGGRVVPIGSGLEGVSLEEVREPVTNPLKRQYAGGAYTVRGFGQNLLGPKVLLANASELADTTRAGAGACDPTEVTEKNIWICDPTAAGLTSDDVVPRPVGGENSVVANAELRWPLGSRWTGVVFVDLGKVWTVGGEKSEAESLAWSPGIGLRYRSPVGPLRLDIGYNTGSSERLRVVSVLGTGAETTIVQLSELFNHDPFEGSGLRGFLNRLQLHFSIGHAF